MKKTQLLSLVVLTACNGSVFADETKNFNVAEMVHTVEGVVHAGAVQVSNVAELVVELAGKVDAMADEIAEMTKLQGVRSVSPVEGANAVVVIVEEAYAQAVQEELAKCKAVVKCGCNKPKPTPKSEVVAAEEVVAEVVAVVEEVAAETIA
jgi:hypothetical protein